MITGNGMGWPLASEYAKDGWAVRREGWRSETTDPLSSLSSLRWLVYHHGLFHLTYILRNAAGAATGHVNRVVTNTDFSVEEFSASDWTVRSPNCAPVAPNYNQQGKLGYGENDGYGGFPSNNPVNPNTTSGACPKVPSIDPPPNEKGCGPCEKLPVCGSLAKLVPMGKDDCGCSLGLCQPLFCPDPVCMPGFHIVFSGFDERGCAKWRCAKTCVDIVCPTKTRKATVGFDSFDCPIYTCEDICKPCPPVVCPLDKRVFVSGVDECGCSKFVCWDGKGLPPPPPIPIPPPPIPPPPTPGPAPGPPPPRPPPPACQPADITVEIVNRTPTCFGPSDYDSTIIGGYKQTITVRVSLAAASDPCAEGSYWVTGHVNSTNLNTGNMSPGDSQDFDAEVSGTPNSTPISVRGSAYLQRRRITSRDNKSSKMSGFCGSLCSYPPVGSP